jgi:Kdo2-lipid IVA lauroyltransferase/acyltransferase
MTARAITDAQRAAARASRARMMAQAKARKRVPLYLLHTALIRPIVWLLSALPVEAAANLGGWIGRHIIPRFADHTNIRRNMRVPFPSLTDDEADKLTREMSENIGRVLGESLHLEAFSGRDTTRLDLTGTEHIEAARAQGRGILFIGGHFANWELFEVALANLGLSGAKVLQHPSNPFVLETIALHRYAHGLDEQIATGEGVFARVRDALRAGRVVQMLADQRTRKGAKVPFCGLETVTNLVPARAARETQAPVILMSMRRTGPSRFAVDFQPARTFGPDDDEVAIMAWVNAFFEAELRAIPGQWLWGHPRWNDVFDGRPAQPLVTPPPGR